MTFEETYLHIEGLKHLIGQEQPHWHQPILDIIPAPRGDCFLEYIRTYLRTGSVLISSRLCLKSDYDVLLIFNKSVDTGHILHEWYSMLY